MIAFINSFLTYILIFLIMATIMGVGITLGIILRKRKNKKAELSLNEEKNDTTKSA